MKSELELDHLFWNAINTDLVFRAWFLQHTKFSHIELELVVDEKWHQRWYRDPGTKMESEGDILLIFKDPVSGDRYAIHIENKPAHGAWRANQPENYRKRAEDRKEKWNYKDYQLVLIAPLSLIKRSSEVTHFDLTVSYEEIGTFLPEFKHACV